MASSKEYAVDTAATSTTELPKEASLYWIHCNRCFEIYTQKKRQVFLLKCYHISCEHCLKSTEDKNLYACPICNKAVRICLLGNEMAPHIKQLFHPEPWLNNLPTMHILRFQQKHMQHFVVGMNRMSREYSILKQSCEKARAVAKADFMSLENKRHERKRLEERARKVKERIKEVEEENVKREMERPRAPPSSTTDESGIGTVSGLFEPRPRYPNLFHTNAAHRRGANSLVALGPRMLSPNSASDSFKNFTHHQYSFPL